MYHFLEHPNSLLWNTRFTEAEELLEPTRETIPSSALIFATSAILQYAVTGEASLQETIQGRIAVLLRLVKRYLSRPAERVQLAHAISELNSACECEHCVERTSTPAEEEAEPREEEEEGEGENGPTPTPNRVTTILPDEPPVTDEAVLLRNLEVDLLADKAISFLFKGLNGLMMQSYLPAGVNLRRSWKAFQAIQSAIPRDWNGGYTEGVARSRLGFEVEKSVAEKIAFGTGVFLFIISVLPDLIRAILSVIGFQANRDRGVALLHSCTVDPRGFTSGFGAFMLAVNYLFIPRGVGDIEESLRLYRPVMERILAHFPTSAHFEFLAAQFSKKGEGLHAAIGHLEKAINSCSLCGIDAPTNYLFELGHCYFAVGNYEKALEVLAPLSEKAEFNNAPMAGIEAAICQSHLSVDIEQVIASVERARTVVAAQRQTRLTKFVALKLKSIDGLAKDRSQPRRRRRRGDPIVFDRARLPVVLTWTGYELLYLRRDLAHLDRDRAGTILTAFTPLEEQVQVLNSIDVQAGCWVVRAELLRQMDEPEEEIRELLRRVVEVERRVRFEKHWVVSAMYALGELDYFIDEFASALEWMKRAKRLSKYPFEEVLKARIGLTTKAILEKLREQQQTL